mmetsp:Transcript_80484/g.209202  ORF Transcript_80484/g.209202 Transcript_80484/m.209202 type:complete len:447 (-) Transcript_80484:619-1959(-)
MPSACSRRHQPQRSLVGRTPAERRRLHRGAFAGRGRRSVAVLAVAAIAAIALAASLGVCAVLLLPGGGRSGWRSRASVVALGPGLGARRGRLDCRGCRGHRTLRRFFSFGGEEEVEEEEGSEARFFSFADGEGDDARLSRDALKSLLECTDNFCLAKHWLPDSFVENVYKQYAQGDGISLSDFARLERDGLLLEGKLDEYEQAFAAMDIAGTGLITRECLGKLFAGLGRVLSAKELDRIVDEADVAHDGIDFADFLGLARTHLELRETLRYLETHSKRLDDDLPVDLSSPEFAPDAFLGEVTTVHGEAELDAIIANGADTIVMLAFTWCRPCKAFWPKYQKYAQIYKNTRFLKIVGNENESCKHYARDVLKASNSPTFAVYSKGRLVEMWHGPNTAHFIENIEKHLESASALVLEREVAVAADPKLAPATPQRESILRGKIAWGRA